MSLAMKWVLDILQYKLLTLRRVCLFPAAIYLQDRRVVMTYDLGSGVAVLTSEPLSLDQWHTVAVTLVQRWATLQVDSGHINRTVSPGPSTQLQTARVTYLGGVAQTVRLPQALPFTTGYFVSDCPSQQMHYVLLCYIPKHLRCICLYLLLRFYVNPNNMYHC